MKEFSLNTRIISGQGSLNHISELKADYVCIVTDKTMVKIGVVKKVTSILEAAKIHYKVFDSVEANPSLDTVKVGLHHIIEYKPDALIAIGGGSVIDAAKAIIYFCILTKEALMHKTYIAKPTFVAIPTTSGTGSEVTSFSVITDTNNHTKIPLSNPLMLPNIAILEPALILSVPKNVTADTGMDVITHAIEAYVATSASVFSDLYAKKALEMAFGNLHEVFLNGQNILARQQMHEASCMAGLAFTNAGLGITHSLAHAVGGRFAISHGRANAILLPLVMEFNSGLIDNRTTTYGDRYDTMAKFVGFDMSEAKERIRCLIQLIQGFNEQVDIPSSFKAYGIDQELYYAGIEEMTDKALDDVCTTTNPRPISKVEIRLLLTKAFG